VKPYGQTAIFDALILAADQMEHAKHTKKAILLITDGVDNSSKNTLSDAINRLKRSRIAVYTVGLLSMSGGQKAEDALLHIAEASGGRAYFRTMSRKPERTWNALPATCASSTHWDTSRRTSHTMALGAQFA
jgi:Ca-activated chloride channel family protein